MSADPGPLSRSALALGSLDVLALVIGLFASAVGLGWVTLSVVLIVTPLTLLLASAARQRERGPRSRKAADRGLLMAGGALAAHLLLTLAVGFVSGTL